MLHEGTLHFLLPLGKRLYDLRKGINMTGKETRQAWNNVESLLIRLRQKGIVVRVEDVAYVIQSPTSQMSTPWKVDTLEQLTIFADGVLAGWTAKDRQDKEMSAR